MLACDWKEDKLRFPLYAQPKIDGVRALNFDGQLTGRSLKPHANKYVTKRFSHPMLRGFDGEMAAQGSNHPSLCRLTTSALNTIEGEPYVEWHLFDHITNETINEPYRNRIRCLRVAVERIREAFEVSYLFPHLKIVPSYRCETIEELLNLESRFEAEGYEGTIIRDINGKYKQGRSTVREGGLLRIKRFIEEEAVVLSITEGESNMNDAQQNELGLQFRTSHQAGMVPNGLVGSLQCLVVKTGEEITVAAGRMTHHEREVYFRNQEHLIGKTIKYKFFPKGGKDKPRFPTFQCIRVESDM